MIERSGGLIVEAHGIGYAVGNGYSGATAELDATVQRAAEMLSAAYEMPVVIRFNSDRLSGGAWLKTSEVDEVWKNAEIGLCAHVATEASNARRKVSAERYGEPYEPLPLGVTVQAHISERAAKNGLGYYHLTHPTLEDALAFVLANAELPEDC